MKLKQPNLRGRKEGKVIGRWSNAKKKKKEKKKDGGMDGHLSGSQK